MVVCNECVRQRDHASADTVEAACLRSQAHNLLPAGRLGDVKEAAGSVGKEGLALRIK